MENLIKGSRSQVLSQMLESIIRHKRDIWFDLSKHYRYSGSRTLTIFTLLCAVLRLNAITVFNS